MLKRYVEYNLWANRRLVDNLRAVPADVVSALPLAPFGSIHGVLRHIVGAQNIWLQRVRGDSPSDFMQFTEGKSTDELCAMLIRTSEAWVEYIDANPQILEGAIRYATTTGDQYEQSIADVVMHVVNHSTYHRGQVMSALRSAFDGKLLGLDMIVFSRQ